MPFRNHGLAANGEIYRVRVEVSPVSEESTGGFRAKFEDGAGIGCSRRNPWFYEVVGRWFCNEVSAFQIHPDGTEDEEA